MNRNQSEKRDGALTDAELLDAMPPTARGRELRVGAFVILGLLGFLVLLFLMTDPAWFRGRYILNTRVDAASGIRRGDPVQLRGVNIGRVQGFRLEGDSVVIALEIDEGEIDGDWGIPVDSRAEVGQPSVMGMTVVRIIPGRSGAYAPYGGEIPGSSTLGLLDAAEDVSVDAREIARQVSRLLSDDNVQAVEDALRETNALLSEFQRITDGRAEEIQAVAEALRAAAEDAQGVSSEVRSMVDSGSMSRTLESAERAARSLEGVSSDAQGAVRSLSLILDRMERGEGTLGKLSRDEELYDGLVRAAETLNDLLADVRENPGRYIKIEVF